MEGGGGDGYQGLGRRIRTPKRRNTQFTVCGGTGGVESPDRAEEMETHDGALGDQVGAEGHNEPEDRCGAGSS